MTHQTLQEEDNYPGYLTEQWYTSKGSFKVTSEPESTAKCFPFFSMCILPLCC